jgi:hypothetical protein
VRARHRYLSGPLWCCACIRNRQMVDSDLEPGRIRPLEYREGFCSKCNTRLLAKPPRPPNGSKRHLSEAAQRRRQIRISTQTCVQVSGSGTPNAIFSGESPSRLFLPNELPNWGVAYPHRFSSSADVFSTAEPDPSLLPSVALKSFLPSFGIHCP